MTVYGLHASHEQVHPGALLVAHAVLPGTLGDFVEFRRAARDRGIRVIADLVVTRPPTSTRGCAAPAPAACPPSATGTSGDKGIVFPDKEKSLWTYDELAGQCYLHRFYKHQPDLNVANRVVRDEIARIMGFLLELGLSGFRVDGVRFLLETQDKGLPDPHDYVLRLRWHATDVPVAGPG